MHSNNLTYLVARGLVASAVVVVCLFGSERGSHAQGAPDDSPQRRRVQRLADQLRVQLDIVEPVQVTIVPTNRLLMSVEPVENGSNGSSREIGRASCRERVEIGEVAGSVI